MSERTPAIPIVLASILALAAPGPGAAAAGGPSRQEAAAARAFADAARAEVRFPGGRTIAAEIADTDERVMYGYMFRKEVREDEGMVFVFREPGVHNFWMKNTLVPLDMIWMDAARTILYIQAAAPPCRADPCPGFGPMRAAAYVLEVRAGTAAREGLKPGDRLAIVFPGDAGAVR